MLNLSIPNGTEYKNLSVPTNLSEITVDYLKAVTADVVIAPNYAIVAYVAVGKLGVLCDLSKKPETGVIFVLVSKNDPNNAINVEDGCKIIAAGTDIMRGIEVQSPYNVLQTSHVIKCINSCCKDLEGRNVKNPYLSLSGDTGYYNKVIYTVGFKLVPLCDIHGGYKKLTEDAENVRKEASEKYYNDFGEGAKKLNMSVIDKVL